MFVYIQGYEWNKYNQTHYDSDNPPPKIVQGYKFNVSSLLGLTSSFITVMAHTAFPYQSKVFDVIDKKQI